MKRSDLTLIKGGKEDNYIYASGYITDTRLMGKMCMCLNWILDSEHEVHQFFAFETEEFGFEDFEWVMDFDVQAISLVEMQLSGGLGARKIDITEDEALYIFNKYVKFNEEHNLPLPEGKKEYSFMIGKGRKLDEGARDDLIAKICGRIDNRYEVINYFLMRCFGQDFEGAGYIATDDAVINGFEQFGISVFCKNTIDKTNHEDIYRCESIIDCGSEYRLVISEVGVRDLEVDGVEILSSMKISDAEAAGILSKSEYVTVYDTDVSPVMSGNVLVSIMKNASTVPFDSGTMYTEFNSTNEHVRKRVYWLNDDMKGAHFITASGQIVISAFREEQIESMERKLESGMLGGYLKLRGKYEFADHMMYEFVRSGYEDFVQFLEDVTGGKF